MTEGAIALVSLVIGAVLTFISEETRRRQARRDDRHDALRTQRAQAYQGFMAAAHEAAHLLGRAANGSDVPLGSDQNRADVLARVDSQVVKRLLDMEILAEDQTLRAARAVSEALRGLRKVVESDAVYFGEEYMAALDVYRGARKMFLAEARREVLAQTG